MTRAYPCVCVKYIKDNKTSGSGVLNPGAVFLRFVTEAFLLFLAPAGSSNPTWPYPNTVLTLNGKSNLNLT